MRPVLLTTLLLLSFWASSQEKTAAELYDSGVKARSEKNMSRLPTCLSRRPHWTLQWVRPGMNWAGVVMS